MTYLELLEMVQREMPRAALGTDNDGQLIVYTDLMENPTGDTNAELVEFEASELD